jgi:hypothetical protein
LVVNDRLVSGEQSLVGRRKKGLLNSSKYLEG